jgi:uncharacterized protein YjdB
MKKVFIGGTVLLLTAMVFMGCPDPTKGGNTGGGGDPVPTVTGVTVSPATASVAKGGTQTFSATVAGTGSPAQTVTWSVSGGTGTTISAGGILSVAAGESATTLTVTATSTVDTTKSGTATVTVTVVTAVADVDKTFSVGYERGTIAVKNAGGTVVNDFTLSKSGTPLTVTLSADGTFTGIIWYVDGVNKGTDTSLVLNVADYTVKKHSVTFTGWRNGSYLSSSPIPFTVTY